MYTVYNKPSSKSLINDLIKFNEHNGNTFDVESFKRPETPSRLLMKRRANQIVSMVRFFKMPEHYRKRLNYHKSSAVYINAVVVNKDMRGRGEGRLLLRRLFKELRAKWVVLEVLKGNAAAIGLYMKMGFKTINQDDDEYVMEKKLRD